MRQNWTRAEELCREALALEPADPMGIELLADLLMERGELDPALERYREAFRLAPGKAALEDKIARTVLAIAEAERERLAAEFALANPASRSERRRNATLAVILALACPGAGQLFLGQALKGGILLVAGLTGLALGTGDLLKLMVQLAGSRLPAHETVHQGLAVTGIIGVLVWLYGLLDASASAGKRPGILDV